MLHPVSYFKIRESYFEWESQETHIPLNILDICLLYEQANCLCLDCVPRNNPILIYMKVLLGVQYWFSIRLYIANVCICMINLQKLQSLNTTLVGIVHENYVMDVQYKVLTFPISMNYLCHGWTKYAPLYCNFCQVYLPVACYLIATFAGYSCLCTH
jgi:hypothetical protein